MHQSLVILGSQWGDEGKGKIVDFIDFSDFKVFDSAGIQTMIYIMKSSDDNENYGLNFSKVLNSKIKHEDAQLFLEKITDEKYEYFISNIIKKELVNQPINFINAELNLIIEKIKSKENFNLGSKEIASGIDLLQDFVNKKHKEVIENVDIGDGIFNLSQSEYDNLHLNGKEKELAESKVRLAKAVRIIESKEREVNIIKESTQREKALDNLVSSLNKEKSLVMRSLLESVQTPKLTNAFDKYLPAVLNEGSEKSSTKKSLTESVSTAQTGNKSAKKEQMIEEGDSNVIDLKRLAGL
jgi:hypothetical protein